MQLPGADLEGDRAPHPLTPNFEAQIFAATATSLRGVGKISLWLPPDTILDPHLIAVAYRVGVNAMLQ